MYLTQIAERHLENGEEGNSQESTQISDNNIFLEVVGGINKKGRIFGVGSQAATFKASTKDSTSTYSTSSEEVHTLKDKVEALTTELQKKTLEHENMKKQMDQYGWMFKRLMLDKNLKALLVPEEEADNCTEDMDEHDLDG